jgi:NAD(P)-dependent dehydrogenase (short-subunit alcohol dehydrogenase family)
LVNLSRHLAAIYGQYGVRINCVSPGGIFDHQPDAFVKTYEMKVPMKRMGVPSDISPAVSFLLSDAAAYITGHNLIVDGGWTAI